jgi:UDP-glucose 4-epimerase
MKVFISGVAGFLASHLADKFIAEGHEVVGCDNFIGGYPDNVSSSVDFRPLDCNDYRISKAMAGCDVVYHLAATAHEGLSVFSPHENTRNGILATTGMISAAIQARVKRFIFTSSMARYGTQDTTPFTEDMIPKPQDPYGIGKYASELVLKNLAETHDMEYVIAVPHNIIGPRQKYDDPFRNVASIMINLMLQGRQPYIYGDGSQERCFSYFTDDIEPLYKMAFADNVVGEIINIGLDREVITILELCLLLAELLDFDVEPIFTQGRPREVHIAHCSADKARRLLGYSPKVLLVDGLQEMIQWIKLRGVKPFKYHLDIEIESDKTPRTWKEKLF